MSGAVVIGGGPAGSVAALCLRRLGHEVAVFERARFPRYVVGESLLPGTLAILERLGVGDEIRRAGFVVKRSATFVWGAGREPWSFRFDTPRTAPWVHDHAFQVTRAEYDRILLQAAAARGASVHEEHEVTSVDGARVEWRSPTGAGSAQADWVIDASGSRGLLRLSPRAWDPFYRNLAVWSYFHGGKRFEGDLAGTTFSISIPDGWLWLIPLKDDFYSVGVVTDVEALREHGPQAFFRRALDASPLVREALATAVPCGKTPSRDSLGSEEVHVVRDWSYQARVLSRGRAFLCGDSACFIDPLFSQGVHLATYSATLAAAAIDRLSSHPQDAQAVHGWYDRSYREAYNRYHKFVAAFYASNQEPDSRFWASRKIRGASDQRFTGVDWFAALSGGVEDLEERATELAGLWQGQDATQIALRRVRHASETQRQLRSMAAVRWASDDVRLERSFQVDPTSFRLEAREFLSDGRRVARAAPATEEHRRLFASLREQPLDYRTLSARLKELGSGPGLLPRLVEEGFVHGYDKEGEVVPVRTALRFGGVGADDDLS